MPEITINYWAVLVAAAANIVVGTLWYGPLFGKAWKRMMGFTDEAMRQMKMTVKGAYLGGIVTALLIAYVLAHDAFVWGSFFGAEATFGFALSLAFWVWLGYVVTTQAGSVLWEGRPWKLFFLNAAQSLVSLIVMASILTFWR
jgi:ABC-type transporter Mla maintaining outer membrane lipid asymmetry permease subunit MlaE